MQWLSPLPTKALLKELQGVKRVLIVDECRKTGSLSERIITFLATEMVSTPLMSCVTAADCFITLGDSWQALLPSREGILLQMVECLSRSVK